VAGTALVDVAGDQLLAHSGLAQNQYCGIGRRDHFDSFEHAPDCGAVSENRAFAGSGSDLLLQILILRLKALT